MNWIGFWTTSIFALAGFFAGSTAIAEQPRFALLIGNQSYIDDLGKIPSAVEDVDLLAQTLSGNGFSVTVVKDATYRKMDISLRTYVEQVRNGGPGAVSLIYYVGHGAANSANGLNYLIPVDVTQVGTTALWDQSLEQSAVFDRLVSRAPDATHFVVFDACRPTLKLKSADGKALQTPKCFDPLTTIPNMLVAYVTEGHARAGVSPFAAALSAEIVKKGVEAVETFRHVQLRVQRDAQQDVWITYRSLPPIYMAGEQAEVTPNSHTAGDTSAAQTSAAALSQPEVALADVVASWDAIKEMNEISVFEAFRRQYGQSNALFDKLAAERIALLKQPGPSLGVGIPAVATPQSGGSDCDGVLVVSMSSHPCIKPGSGQSFQDCPKCPEMVIAPAGSFMMGSPKNEPERSYEEGPQHTVTIPKAFAIGKYSVTFAEWDACVAGGGCGGWIAEDWGWGREDRPVINVSWSDIQSYLLWLRSQTGQNYRLPSEAEFEYAARAGTTTPFWWGQDISPDRANFNGTSEPYRGGGSKGEHRRMTLPVKSFDANPWGLYQVHGNVWSWTDDCWDETYKGAPVDGSPRKNGDCTRRSIRGGSWLAVPKNLRSASRSGAKTDLRDLKVGFRVVRPL